MSVTEKVRLVETSWQDYGLNRSLDAIDLARSSWYYHQKDRVEIEKKYAHLRPLLEEIARDHPEYGYRRTRIELRDVYGVSHSKKLIQKLHGLWGLPLLRRTKAPKSSGIRQVIEAAGDRINLVAQMEQIGLLEVVYTDFTELRYAGGAYKAYLMPILEHTARLVIGWAVGPSANTLLALSAWEHARNTLEAWQARSESMIMHHDQDSVYTGYGWTGELLLKGKLRISYSLDGAKDNPFIESFFSRFKSENRSLFLDAESVDDLRLIVAERMTYYNTVRRHSSLDYQAPMHVVQELLNDLRRPQTPH
jgi:putative transposase